MEETAQLHRETMQHFNERQKRIYAGSLAKEYGWGGINRVHRETGMDPHTIMRGKKELIEPPMIGRMRKTGGGRKRIEQKQPGLIEVLEEEANTKTDKRTVVKWTSHSFAHLREALAKRGFQVAMTSIGRMLHDLGYALKANKKDLEGGKDHPDRDAQFQHINMQGLKMQLKGFPILSIDAKKTEKLGNLKNNGKEWMRKGEETKVDVYDFGEKDEKTKKIKKAIPYGIYDILKKKGFVNVGIDANTAEFAVNSLITWWKKTGKITYPEASEILIFADCGSSNGYKNRLWKYCLQQFANRTGLTVHICHYPPGTSKWNAIEHAMFSFITINWRAQPLVAYEVILELIRNTTTKTGLKIEAVLDENHYETGKKITDEQIEQLNICGNDFHPEWNYSVMPVVS
jgi:hypothetical protein